MSARARGLWMAGAAIVLFVVLVVASDLGFKNAIFKYGQGVPGKDKTGHFLIMGLLSLFVNRGLAPLLRMGTGRAVCVISVVLCVVIALEEFSQGWFASRTFSGADLFCSVAGIWVFAGVAWLWLRRSMR